MQRDMHLLSTMCPLRRFAASRPKDYAHSHCGEHFYRSRVYGLLPVYIPIHVSHYHDSKHGCCRANARCLCYIKPPGCVLCPLISSSRAAESYCQLNTRKPMAFGHMVALIIKVNALNFETCSFTAFPGRVLLDVFIDLFRGNVRRSPAFLRSNHPCSFKVLG